MERKNIAKRKFGRKSQRQWSKTGWLVYNRINGMHDGGVKPGICELNHRFIYGESEMDGWMEWRKETKTLTRALTTTK